MLCSKQGSIHFPDNSEFQQLLVVRLVQLDAKNDGLSCLLIKLDAGMSPIHDDVIKWKHFPHYLPLVMEILRSIPLTKASEAELWCFLWFAFRKNSWVNNREAGDLRRHRARYDAILMYLLSCLIHISILRPSWYHMPLHGLALSFKPYLPLCKFSWFRRNLIVCTRCQYFVNSIQDIN